MHAPRNISKLGTALALTSIVVIGAVTTAGCGGSAKAKDSGGSAGATDTTIPLAQADSTTKFFSAFNGFRACLKGLNVKFIGAPDSSNPSSPSNDPTYVKSLTTCAAKSGIQAAGEAQQAEQDNLTPDQIKTRNEQYLEWRECMIGRGWGIPEPKPDSKGRLFNFGGGGGGAAQFKAPPGQDILTSNDTTECIPKDAFKPASAG